MTPASHLTCLPCILGKLPKSAVSGLFAFRRPVCFFKEY
nr:MAG TPA: hypothetical protein [Caudoviricetes sp.]